MTDSPTEPLTEPATERRYEPGPVLVEVTRSGVVESVHTAHLVVIGPGGGTILQRGRPDLPMFWRSSAKPLQATAIGRAGLTLPADHLALAAASHSGEPEHLRTVTAMLTQGGLTEDDLGCPPDWPIDERARAQAMVAEPGPRRLFMNCSGKHAAMLLACRHNDWPTQNYLDPEHPLQQLVRETVEDLARARVSATAVDGCGMPLFALPLAALARGFAAVAGGQVAAAMRAHPFLVGGTDRMATRLMQAVPGLIAKDGAEGVFAAALPDGSAVACKVDDGAQRAAETLVLAGLRALGVAPDLLPDRPPVLGGGRPVGSVRFRSDGLLPVS